MSATVGKAAGMGELLTEIKQANSLAQLLAIRERAGTALAQCWPEFRAQADQLIDEILTRATTRKTLRVEMNHLLFFPGSGAKLQTRWQQLPEG